MPRTSEAAAPAARQTARLLFVVVAAAVPAALAGALLVGYDYFRLERERLEADALTVSRAIGSAVDAELVGARWALLALSTSPNLEAGNLRGFHAEARQAAPGLRLDNIVLVEASGRQLVNTFRDYGAPLPAPREAPGGLPRVFKTGQPFVSDLFVGPLAKRPFVGVGVPIMREGKVVYGLGGGIYAERLAALVSAARLPAGWVAAVIDSAGNIAARSHDAARLVGQPASPELRRRMHEAAAGAFEGQTVDGIASRTVFSRAPASGWTVAIGIPQRELAMQLLLSLGRLFVIGFIAMVAAVGVALVLARRMRRSGASALFLAVAAIVPAALTVLVLVGYDYFSRERARLDRDALTLARAVASALDTELSGARSALLALSGSPYLATGELGAFHRQARRAMHEATKEQVFDNIIVTDAGGRQLVNTFRDYGQALPDSGDPGGLLRVFQSGEPVISDVFAGRLTQRHFVGIGVPVRRDGAVAYGLNGGLYVERLAGVVREAHLPAGWLAAVVDRAGNVAARSRDAARYVGAPASPDFLNRARGTSEGSIASVSLEGIPTFTVFTRAPTSGWTVAIGVPQRELAVHLLSSLGRLAAVGFIALAAAIGLAIALIRRKP